MQRLMAPVLGNVRLDAPGHFVLRFAGGAMAQNARPGQFVTVGADTGAQILRRPFSFFTADAETGEASLLYSVHGPTSKAMSELKAGDTLDVMGPLGGRVFAADTRAGVRHIMVGGGYGVPPLAFLTRALFAENPAADVHIVNGARTGDFLVGTDGLDAMGAVVLPCTEDGSHGFRGRVTGVLEPLLTEARTNERPVAVYTCGPTPMMRAVAEMSIAFDVPCQASLEVFMPCGVGICMGCAVPRPDGSYARGCVEGPVFEAREILW